MFGKFFRNIVIGMLCALTLSAAASAQTYSNKQGTYDGTYTAAVRNIKTKEKIKKVQVEIEGQFITIKYKTGDVRYKFSDIFDRRYEKEINVIDPDTHEPLVITLK